MKIRFNSDHVLPLKRPLKRYKIVILDHFVRSIGSVFHGGNKYYSQDFLDECLYKGLMCPKELMLINIGVHQKSASENECIRKMLS